MCFLLEEKYCKCMYVNIYIKVMLMSLLIIKQMLFCPPPHTHRHFSHPETMSDSYSEVSHGTLASHNQGYVCREADHVLYKSTQRDKLCDPTYALTAVNLLTVTYWGTKDLICLTFMFLYMFCSDSVHVCVQELQFSVFLEIQNTPITGQDLRKTRIFSRLNLKSYSKWARAFWELGFLIV